MQNPNFKNHASLLTLGKVSSLQQSQPESCRQWDTNAGLSFLSHNKLLLISMINFRAFSALLLSKALSPSWNICILDYFPAECASFYFSTLNLILFLECIFKSSRNFLPFTLFLWLAKQCEHTNSTAEFKHLCSSPLPSQGDSVKQHMAFYDTTIRPGQDFAHNTGWSLWEGGSAVYMSDSFSTESTFIFPSWALMQNLTPGILLPVLLIALPHSFPRAAPWPCSPHSSG